MGGKAVAVSKIGRGSAGMRGEAWGCAGKGRDARGRAGKRGNARGRAGMRGEGRGSAGRGRPEGARPEAARASNGGAGSRGGAGGAQPAAPTLRCLAGAAVSTTANPSHAQKESLTEVLAPGAGDGEGDAGRLDVDEQDLAVGGEGRAG